MVGEYRQQIFEKDQQIAELKASHEKTLLLKENEIEKLQEALQGECQKTSNTQQVLEHQKRQFDHSSSTCTKLTKHCDMLRTTLETERKQSDNYLQEIEKLNIQKKEIKMLLQEARKDLTKQKIINEQEKIAADNTLNKSKLEITNLKGQLQAKHKQDINNLHKKYAGQLAMERDKISGERNAYKRKLAEFCIQQQTSAQVVVASCTPAAAASTAKSSPSVRVTKQGKHKTKCRKKKILPSRARNMVCLSSKAKEHKISPSKNSRKETAPITFTDSPMEKLYSPVLLWQCAVCEKVNDTVHSNCKACKRVRGNSAVTDSFCTPCKLVVYTPVEKEQHMTVCPNCNLLTLRLDQY